MRDTRAWAAAVGHVVSERRAELKLSIAAIAEKGCISRSRVADYNSGRKTPCLPVLSDLALALEMDTGEMIGRIEAIVFAEQQKAAE